MKTRFNIIRQKVTTRGGGIEICLENQGYPGEKMTAYKNYLGGGILGRIGNDCTITDWQQDDFLVDLADSLAKIMHRMTAPIYLQGEELEQTFEQNQSMPISAY